VVVVKVVAILVVMVVRLNLVPLLLVVGVVVMATRGVVLLEGAVL
jgi:hypothetical protein